MELPDILECTHFETFTAHKETDEGIRRVVKDYELDYHLRGARVMLLDGIEYALPDASLICRRPGQLVTSRGYFDMYLLTLDYTHTGSAGAHSRHRPRAVQQAEAEGWDILPPVFVPRHGEEILTIYKTLSLLWQQENRRAAVNDLLAKLLHLVFADALDERLRPQLSVSPVDRAIEYMTDRFSRPLTLDELAGAAFLNRSYFCRLFRAETGMTPMEYLTEIRLKQAKRLLHNTGMGIVEIAGACGFASPAYFTKRFRVTYGITPREYRKGGDRRGNEQ